MRRARFLLAAVVTASLVAVAPAASADESCVGTEETVVVCVEPTGRTLYSDCIYTGGDTCTPVSVPGPDVTRCKILDLTLLLCQVL
jgi:hypothetical protein